MYVPSNYGNKRLRTIAIKSAEIILPAVAVWLVNIVPDTYVMGSIPCLSK